MIALCEPAYVDDFFDLLRAGVRGFAIAPCTLEMLEETLGTASVGLKLHPELLAQENRNLALSRIVVRQFSTYAAGVSAVRKGRMSTTQTSGWCFSITFRR